MIHRPPYLQFNPPPVLRGSPQVVDRANPPPDSRFLHLASDRMAPSSVEILRSFGCQSRPIDSDSRPLTRVSRLFATPQINVRVPFFFTSGTFATARTEAFFRIFVEEFDPANRFVRAVVNPFELVVVREDFWWLQGGRSFETQMSGPNLVIQNPNGILLAQPGFLYRVWIDMVARIRAEGFGGLGGSAAIAQLGWTIDEITVQFV